MATTKDTIKFEFDADEMEIIRAALGQMPHDDVQAIIQKIYIVVQTQVLGEEVSLDAPWGRKKDGTPKKRPGRAPK